MPPPMSTPGSRVMATGLTNILLSVRVGIHPGTGTGTGAASILLGFMGVLVGANVVAVGARTADGQALNFPVALDAARALAALLRRNINVPGLVVVSIAVTSVAGDTRPALCFAMLGLFVLGLALICTGVLHEYSY